MSLLHLSRRGIDLIVLWDHLGVGFMVKEERSVALLPQTVAVVV